MIDKLHPRTRQPVGGVVLLLAIVVLMWLVEGLNSLTSHGNALDGDGAIYPRNFGHVWSIFTAPFLHFGWQHLIDNTIPFVFMGVFIAIRGAARLALVTLIVVVVGGFGTWLIAPAGTETVGASGVVFGYATYLFTRGIFDRSLIEIGIGLVVGVVLGRRAAREHRAPAGDLLAGTRVRRDRRPGCRLVAGLEARPSGAAGARRGPDPRGSPPRGRAGARPGVVACPECGSSPAFSPPGASISATTSGRSPSTWPARIAARASTASLICTRSPSRMSRRRCARRSSTRLRRCWRPAWTRIAASCFARSDVHEHTELTWLLSGLTELGRLQRMHQFRDKSAAQRELVSSGLLFYPVLQAADVLGYRADEVPVGEDQREHLELMRDVARRFNSRFGETLVVPEHRIPAVGARIMDLQAPERKMSTTGGTPQGTVLVLDDATSIAKKIRSAVTDTGSEVRRAPDKPGVSNLIDILAAVRGADQESIEAEFDGSGYGSFKQAVADEVVAYLAPVRERYEQLRADEGELERILATGADKARGIISETMVDVRAAMGVGAVRPRG